MRPPPLAPSKKCYRIRRADMISNTMPESRHELKHLARAYFHQDFYLDSPTALDVIRLFQETESAGAIAELRADIESILRSPMSEREIYNLWIKDFGASYDPIADGETYRSWFSRVVAELS
jgi:hypothetical protein